MYNIIGIYKGNKEVIDTAKDEQEAIYLINEYQLAYGNDWRIYYEKYK